MESQQGDPSDWSGGSKGESIGGNAEEANEGGIREEPCASTAPAGLSAAEQ